MNLKFHSRFNTVHISEICSQTLSLFLLACHPLLIALLYYTF